MRIKMDMETRELMNLTVFGAEETLHLLSQLKNHLSNVF